MNQEEIKALLGKDAQWMDKAGNSLLHLAAQSGDAGLVEACLKAGVKTLLYNKDGECARDVARIWGYDALAVVIDAGMKQERAATPQPPLGYASLQEIRDQSAATGVNVFHALAAEGKFDQVAALAKKESDGFTAQDFLAAGADGDKAILKICQQGQLAELMKPELWVNSLGDFLSVWENVPKVYRKDMNVEAFMSRTRQLKLTSRAPKTPFRKGPQ
ncbi:MAG: ankyrin repeat domain-containing protein [Alphaproteobacteria bacterium]|nr:ankyrin repeat domain-containing protein [Alphaproteobacteria bacterium]